MLFPYSTKLTYYVEIMILIHTSLALPAQSFFRSYFMESSLIFAGSFYHFIPALVLSIIPFASCSLSSQMAGDGIGGFASAAIVTYLLLSITSIQVISS